MKAENLKKRLDNRFNGNKSTKVYKVIIDLIEGTNNTYLVNNNTIRPVQLMGGGRHSKYADYTSDMIDLLNLLSLKYDVDNDAPKGGKAGTLIKIKTKIIIMPNANLKKH